MAPYVRRQYDATSCTRSCASSSASVTRAASSTLASSSTTTPRAHSPHIKPAEGVEEEVDRLRRVRVLRTRLPEQGPHAHSPPAHRHAARARAGAAAGEEALERDLSARTTYAGVDTCAVDGMCATSCPLSINTGALVKRLRRAAMRRGKLICRGRRPGWARRTRGGAAALTLARALPPPRRRGGDRCGAGGRGGGRRPALTTGRFRAEGRRGTPCARRGACEPGAGRDLSAGVRQPCFGAEDGGIGVTAAFVRLAERARVRLLVPDGIESVCCGTPM